MLKKTILFVILNTLILANSADSTITLSGIKPITITANNNDLKFGENEIVAGKTLVPISPISLVINGVYPKAVTVRVPKEINLISVSNSKKEIIFNSSLKGDNRDGVIIGNQLLWNSRSQVLGSTSINLDFSGSILLTNLEEVGVYEGIARIDVEYN